MTATADDHDEENFPRKGLVAPRYMGTIADQKDMSALGRVQVLRVSGFFFFSYWVETRSLGTELTRRRGIFGLFRLLGLDAP
jgi:hypothetical protein